MFSGPQRTREGIVEGTGVREYCQGMEECALPFPVLGPFPEITGPAAGISIVAAVKLKQIHVAAHLCT